MTKTLAIDFDGVMNNYKGWRGEEELFTPRDGVREFLDYFFLRGWTLKCFTAREPSKVSHWLYKHKLLNYFTDVTNQKPAANVTLDDRAVTFTGDWTKAIEAIENFTPHWQR